VRRHTPAHRLLDAVHRELRRRAARRDATRRHAVVSELRAARADELAARRACAPHGGLVGVVPHSARDDRAAG
jgi:hypothetical protein